MNGTIHIYVSKDVRIRDYFSNPKGVCKQLSLGNTNLKRIHRENRLLVWRLETTDVGWLSSADMCHRYIA